MTHYLLFGGSLALLLPGGDRPVSTRRLTGRAGLSAVAAGAVIVGFDASMPEPVTSADADLRGYPGGGDRQRHRKQYREKHGRRGIGSGRCSGDPAAACSLDDVALSE